MEDILSLVPENWTHGMLREHLTDATILDFLSLREEKLFKDMFCDSPAFREYKTRRYEPLSLPHAVMDASRNDAKRLLEHSPNDNKGENDVSKSLFDDRAQKRARMETRKMDSVNLEELVAQSPTLCSIPVFTADLCRKFKITTLSDLNSFVQTNEFCQLVPQERFDAGIFPICRKYERKRNNEKVGRVPRELCREETSQHFADVLKTLGGIDTRCFFFDIGAADGHFMDTVVKKTGCGSFGIDVSSTNDRVVEIDAKHVSDVVVLLLNALKKFGRRKLNNIVVFSANALTSNMDALLSVLVLSLLGLSSRVLGFSEDVHVSFMTMRHIVVPKQAEALFSGAYRHIMMDVHPCDVYWWKAECGVHPQFVWHFYTTRF